MALQHSSIQGPKSMEDKAIAEWGEKGAAHAREFVAIGFLVDEHLSESGEPFDVWYELPNQAGVGEFLIDSVDIQSVMQTAYDALGHEAWTRCDRVLWHSHYIAACASAEDIANFPEWLVNVGLVYHTPTGVTIPYSAGDRATQIALTALSDAALETPGVVSNGR